MPEPAQAHPVTFEQQAMWLHDCLYDGQSIYLESWVSRLRGAVDLAAADWAIRQVVARHAALHSGIRLHGGQLVQVRQPDHVTDIERLRCPERSLGQELRRLVRRPLDVSTSPVRVTCLDVGAGDVVLVWQLHHLVVDDWALSILEREFGEFYRARVAGRRCELPLLTLLPGEYAAAQRASGFAPGLVDYWRERLRDAPAESTVPPDWPPPDVPTHRGGLVRFGIAAALGNGVRELARRSRTTPFTVLAAAAAALLAACNGAPDQVLGTVVSRRGAAGLDQMVTCLADLLPLRLRVPRADSFGELLRSARLVVTETVAHRDVPFSVLLRETGGSRSSTRPAICQLVLVVDDVPRAGLDLPGVQAERLYVHSGIAKFDLEITLVQEGDCYAGFLVYASDLFSTATARALEAGFRALLERAVNRPDLPLETILSALPSALPSGMKRQSQPG